MADGAAALEKWIAKRAQDADRIVALEESLLSGGFTRYALRRLSAFGMSRLFAISVHVLELTLLFQIFSAKPFMASLALQNVTLIVDAFFWGALEAYRRRARELGPTSESAALATRWMALGFRLGIAVLVATVAFGTWTMNRQPNTAGILVAYASVCCVRLLLDLVLRSYYSGIFAYRRVHRPIWSAIVAPVILLGGVVATWRLIGAWSFVVALGLSVLVTRALLFWFSRRAYRRHQVPPPSLRIWRSPRLRRSDFVGAPSAGAANLTARLGSVVLLAAVIPSLVSDVDFGGGIEPLAYALHVASPLVLLASQWTFVFYHDEKRLEDEASEALGLRFQRRLVVVGVLMGVVAWGGTVVIVLRTLSWTETESTLVPLLPAMVGLALFAIVQLRAFARGDFGVQAVGALAMLATASIVVLAGVSSSGWSSLTIADREEPPSLVGLAVAPWVGMFVHVSLAWSLGRRIRLGAVLSLAAWTRALKRSKDAVSVWEGIVERKPALVAERLANALGKRGAVHVSGMRVIWFERGMEATRKRRDWLALAGGQLLRLCAYDADTGVKAVAELESLRTLLAPKNEKPFDELVLEHARLFPDGFVLPINGAPPGRFLALPAATRQAIWREARAALRPGRRNKRSTSGWSVVAFAPHGAVMALFVRPKGSDPTKIASLHAATTNHLWRLGPVTRSSDERRKR